MEGVRLLTFDAVKPRMYGVEFPEPISFVIRRGEQLALLGRNGAGKTLLLDVISGKTGICCGEIKYHFFDDNARAKGFRFPTEMIKRISFESAYKMADYGNMYYQQRFNALENDLMPTAGELLKSRVKSDDDSLIDELTETLRLSELMEKRLIMLSSGELRRFLIASALLERPSLLLIDNPFIGLDRNMREEIDIFFTKLSNEGWNMVFFAPSMKEVPSCVNKIVPVVGMKYGAECRREEVSEEVWSCESKDEGEFELPQGEESVNDYEYVLKFNNINISYTGRTLFKDLEWKVRKGEKWSLSGENGAGKSTLLSLLSADNPRAYSQDIVLFDRKRGTGESIWDIKKHIGYISSEMHLYFREDQNCLKIVASGFYDTIGLFRKATEEQERKAMEWMSLFGIAHLKERSFLKISGGEQRLVLICRTMVKNPDLLILDEPLHGLDDINKWKVKRIIEKYAAQSEKTMIYVTHRVEETPECVCHHYELKKEK